jgi:hypothetical protein
MRTRYILLILILISTSSCSIYKQIFLTDYKKFLSNEELNTYKNPEKPAIKSNYPEDEAITLYEERKAELIQDKNEDMMIAYSKHSLIKLFSNINEASETYIYLEQDEKLIDINARIIQPNDSIIYLTKENFIYSTAKYGEDENSKKNESQVIKFVFPNIHENSIIEYSYRILKDFSFFGDIWPIEDDHGTKIYSKFACYLGKYLTKLNYSYSYISPYSNRLITNYDYIKIDFELGLNYQLFGDTINDNIKFKKSMDGDLTTYMWEINNSHPFKKEKNMPPIKYFLKRLSFNFLKKPEWKLYSDYYFDRYHGNTFEEDKYTRSVFDSIVTDTKSNLERIEKLTQYVKDLRYEAIPLGNHGIIPNNPYKTLKNGFGDCKDKAILLIHFLNFMEKTAYPAIILTADNGLVDKSFPIWNFNHMIVLVADSVNGDFWIDPTVTKGKYNQLPWEDEGVNALMFGDKKNVGFLQTPISDTEKNRRIAKIKIYNLDSTIANADIELKFYGIEDLEMRNRFFDLLPKEREEKIKIILGPDFSASKIDSISFSDFNDYSKPFELKLKISSDRILNTQGNITLLNYDVLAKNDDSDWNQTTERKYPVFIPYKSISEKEIEIYYPKEKLKVNFLPDEFNENIEYCSYEKSFIDDNNGTIYCKSKYVENALSIPKEKFNIAKNFNLNINKYNQKRIILEQIK